jgi:hypothetical protein
MALAIVVIVLLLVGIAAFVDHRGGGRPGRRRSSGSLVRSTREARRAAHNMELMRGRPAGTDWTKKSRPDNTR